MERVVIMSPLPDADPDKRIYALLKNTDLENLSFSDFQGVAEKVYAEQGAEDTLRRIVLVNLARLAVAGEWSGLTSSGGSSSTFSGPVESAMSAGQDMCRLDCCYPAPSRDATTASMSTNNPQYYPFVCPESGDVGTITIRSNGTVVGQQMLIGFYKNTDDGYPGAQIGGTTSIDLSSSTTPTGTPASTVTLSRGTTYWVGYVQEEPGASDPTMWVGVDGVCTPWNSAIGQVAKNTLRESTNSNSLPSTAPTSGYSMQFNQKLIIGMTIS